jgi:hypothetical protein
MKESRKKEAYVSVTRRLLDSHAYKSLSDGAVRLLFDVRYALNGFNNCRLMITLRVLKHRGWRSTRKLVRARDELLDKGILKYTRRCSPNKKSLASWFAFTDLPVLPIENEGIAGRQPTHDYENWTPKSAIRAFPKRETCGSRNGKAAVPVRGKLTTPSSPATRKRKNEPNEMNAKANAPNFEKKVSFPAMGNEVLSIAIGTAGEERADGPSSPPSRVAGNSAFDCVLQTARSKNNSRAEINEFDRAQARYEQRRARLARANDSP